MHEHLAGGDRGLAVLGELGPVRRDRLVEVEQNAINAAGNNSGGLQNTWFIKAAAGADITKDLDGKLSVYYLRAVNSFQKEFNASTTSNLNSKAIGTEVDGIVNYKIDRQPQILC